MLSGNQVTGLSVLGVPMRSSVLLRGVEEIIRFATPFFRTVMVLWENRRALAPKL